MPYIPLADRAHSLREPLTPGELNYAIQELTLAYLRKWGLCYDTLNEVVGALTCAKDEFVRRVIVPYEEKACARNGDLDWSIE